MDTQQVVQPLASPVEEPMSYMSEIENQRLNWSEQSSVAPSSKSLFELHIPRRPSNPIAIPRPQSAGRSSATTSIGPASPVICLRCGLHSRPTTADIIQAGGCSPTNYNLETYIRDQPLTRQTRRQQPIPYQSNNHRCTTDQYMDENMNINSNSSSSATWYQGPTVSSSSRRHDSLDSIYPTFQPTTLTSTTNNQRKRHHHRRRSSLCNGPCNGPNLIDEATELKWRCERDIFVDNKDEADRIARNVSCKGRRRSQAGSVSSSGSGLGLGSISVESVILED